MLSGFSPIIHLQYRRKKCKQQQQGKCCQRNHDELLLFTETAVLLRLKIILYILRYVVMINSFNYYITKSILYSLVLHGSKLSRR